MRGETVTDATGGRDAAALEGDDGRDDLQEGTAPMSLFTRAFPKWLPIAVAVTLAIGISYLFVQQDYRQSANDPQIQVARDVAAGLASGRTAGELVSATDKVDPSKSLAPFVIVLDASGKVVVSSMVLGSSSPVPPAGVLATAKSTGEYKVTWQPRPDARIASVVVPVNGGSGGYVIAGRSLQAVEARVDQLTQLAGLGWLATMVLTFIAVLVADRARGDRAEADPTA